MKDFAMSHPWMVFWLVVLLGMLLNDTIETIVNRNKPPQPKCTCVDDEE